MTDPSPLRAPQEAYQSRLSSARVALLALDRRGALLANLRAGSFLAAVVAAGLTLYGQLPSEGWALAAGLAVLYGGIAYVHHQVIQREEHQKVRVLLCERGIARLTGGWHTFPERGDRFAHPEHLYLPDLDVFGQGSLFQLIDESGTRAGEERLAAWLSQKADPTTVRQRQEAVRELAPLLDFRQRLVVESRLASRAKADPARFIRWAQGGPYLEGLGWAPPLAWVLPPLTLGLFIAGQLQWVPRAAWWAGFVGLLLTQALTRKRLAEFYDLMSLGEAGFVRFENVFAVVEGQAFQSGALTAVAARVRGEAGKTSASLRRFSRLFGFAELRQSPQLHAAINTVTLWDIHWLFRLERWRREQGGRVGAWFDGLAELEALSSLAGLAHDRPDFTFPQVVEGPPQLLARGLGHPLLDQPVRNDVLLPAPGHALVITGSNMSGKTTLLRALGANAVLALAGAPVSAGSLTLSPLDVLTSMRVKDSLERGVSYFYAEVQRLKALLDAVGKSHVGLFLLDEILLGTNTAERQIASREVLRLFLEAGSIGGVATHDLSLATFEKVAGFSVKNVHFEDQVQDGKMTFDYRMREGVVTATNALRVLRDAGIEVRDTPAPERT